MKSTMFQYDNQVEKAVERLLQLGVFKSKADIFRVGAMELAIKYGLVKTRDEVIEEMMLEDARPALEKLKARKTRLHKIEDL